jgi:hypothetical protein
MQKDMPKIILDQTHNKPRKCSLQEKTAEAAQLHPLTLPPTAL